MGWFTAFQNRVYPQGKIAIPLNPNFSLSTAGALAWAAQLSYEVHEDGKLDGILRNWGWQKIEVLSGQFASKLPLVSTKGFIAELDGGMVIAFAGTEPTDLLNWITDFDIHQTADGVADGFYAGVEAIWQKLVETVGQRPGAIYLAGHSLGAALAAIAAKRLIEERAATDRIFGVYTIGMPRIGNAAFAAGYNAALGQRTYRLVHGDDIVPKVPPAEAPFDFRHVGRLLSCPRGGPFAAANLQALAPETPADAGGSLKGLLGQPAAKAPAGPWNYPGEHAIATAVVEHLPAPLRDHLPDCYLRALGSLP